VPRAAPFEHGPVDALERLVPERLVRDDPAAVLPARRIAARATGALRLLVGLEAGADLDIVVDARDVLGQALRQDPVREPAVDLGLAAAGRAQQEDLERGLQSRTLSRPPELFPLFVVVVPLPDALPPSADELVFVLDPPRRSNKEPNWSSWNLSCSDRRQSSQRTAFDSLE
jgi:hypothetical protein